MAVNSRRIEDLDPEVRIVAARHLALCHERGIELIVTSTYRDFAAQDALYAIGRTVQKDRRPVTKAPGGRSWHNYKSAWDVVPVIGGKPVWDERDPLWSEVVLCGVQAGAEAGANWPLFKDMPHFQVLPEKHFSFESALARFEASGTIFTA